MMGPVPSDGSMVSGSAIPDNCLLNDGEATLAEPSNDHSDNPHESPDADFASMFEDANTMAKRTKKISEGN